MDRSDIEAILKKKVADLANEKNKDGMGFKRGTFSKTFKRVDASTYLVAFHQDTIVDQAQPDTDEIKTERFELTVTKTGGKWGIAKQDLKDTYVGLYRGYFGGEGVFKFGKLQFEKEGLKVSATNGWGYTQRVLGHVTGYAVFADDLRFDYAPPADTAETSHYSALYKKLAKDHPEDAVFKPSRLAIYCDAKTCEELASAVFTDLQQVGEKSTGSGTGADGAAGRMLKRLQEASDEVKKNRRENPFGGFDRPDDPDNRYWRFSFKRDGAKEHFAALTYDNLEPWQMSYFVTDYGQLYAYYSEDTRNKGLDPLILEERGDKEARDFDLVAMKGAVDLALDDPYAYAGDITYKLKIKRELKDLPFFVARVRYPGEKEATKSPKLFINSIQDAQGNELTWSRFTSSGGLVVFPKTLQAGDMVTLRLQFLNYDAIYSLNPSFYGLSRGGWLPFVRFGDFIDDFDLTVRLPDKYQILGVGKVESDTAKDGIRTAHFTSPSPVTFPTIIFGDYITDDAGDYKATKTDGTVIPVHVFVDKGSLAGLNTQFTKTEDIDDYFRSAAAGARDIRGKQLRAIATQAAVALNLYKEIYGVDYPFAKLDLVSDPLGDFYGQAPASLIYLGSGVFRGEGEVVDRTSRSASNISKFNKDVVAHETGHQWWGGLVTNANDRNYWFVETLAELSSAIYVERTQGKKKYLEKVEEWRNTIMDNDPLNSVQNGYTTWSGEGFRSAVANIYNKGPYAFHIFRSTFGDEKFFQLLREMAQTLQHKEIVTREMQDVMEKVVGGNMDWFFDQWLRGVGTPQYALFWTKRKNEQGKWIVEGSIKQRVVMGQDKTELKGVYYRGVAPFTFVDLNGKEVKSAKPMLVQGAETPFRVIVADEPAQVFFNKDGEILAEELLINRSW
ncbi:MAG TPA: M1 family aminopeptidase [Candidatus Polarisedimenticolaceae bacterium]|nr:M1 family aminopeptidase [Candidatus Polarisedimenticolaceae bacterium]